MEGAMEEMISSGLAGMAIEAEGKTRGNKSCRWEKRALRKKRKDEMKPSSLMRGPDLYHEVSKEKPEISREEDVIPKYRGLWDCVFAGEFGSFEDETTLGPMRHTFGPMPPYASPDCTLQIFYVRVTELEDGLQWPLDVHGLVAARDSVDHNRNFLFRRTRDNCQTLTKEDPYLLLTGPSRVIVVIDPVTFEVQLKVKGKTESEDEMLAFTIFNWPQTFHSKDVIRTCMTCKRCTVELGHAPLLRSVEATISVQVVGGTWPDCLRGCVFSRTTSIKEGTMLLLDSRDGKMPISSAGAIELARRVVSLDLMGGELIVSVLASQIGKDTDFVAQDEAVFRPKRAGTSHGMCDIGFCKMQVTIAWSLLSTLTDLRRAARHRAF